VIENLADDDGVFDAGDDLHGAAAGLAGRDVDVEYPLEALRPVHGGMAFGGCSVYGCIGRFGFSTLSATGWWQGQGNQAEAHNLLSGIYNWFTEGFDTKDLQDTKALLDQLT
jgi:hypothetical protein